MSFDRFLLPLAGCASIFLSVALSLGIPISPGFMRSGDSAVEEGLARNEALESKLDHLQIRLEDKFRIAQSLIEGRLGFADAVAQFRATDEAGGQAITATVPVESTDTVDMSYARSVACWADGILLNREYVDEAARVRISSDLRHFLEAARAYRATDLESERSCREQ